MRRREFITLVGSAAAAWPLVAPAQQPPKLPTIGFLTSYSPDAIGQGLLAAFRQGLAEAGFVGGKNATIEVHWAEGHYDRLPAMAADLARRQISVIATAGNNAGLSAKAATTITPIVFCMGGDPVGLGLVANLANPGANVTGATRMHIELGPKRLQLMHEMVPTATSMALLINPATPTTAESERKLVEARKGRKRYGVL
jgi:putative tryptophan/tyrosine transport system substrate-binding protein